LTIRTLRVTKRVVAAVATAALGATLLALPTSPVSATATVTSTSRLDGPTRYETTNKVAVASNQKGTGLQNIYVLANGDSFADGLTAASLGGSLTASVLLTPQAALPSSVLATITSMSVNVTTAKFVVIVGGEAAVSAGIAEQLTALGYTVSRVKGETRYGTANAVAASTKINSGGSIGLFGGYRTAFLASGTNFPDALAVSGWAFSKQHPIFLTDGTTLSAETEAAMVAAGVQQVFILGGTAAVSDSVKASVEAVTGVIVTTRIGGETRYETATLVAAAIGAQFPNYLKSLIFVDGTNFPDALGAAQRSHATSASIILVTSPLPTVVSEFIAANKATIATIETIGGTEAVAASTVAEGSAAATIAQPTATIEALDGSTKVTVTFSEQLNEASAETVSSYTRTTSAGVITNPSGPVYTFDAATSVSKVVLTFAALTPGDTIRVVGNVIAHATVPSLTVATASTTVEADVSVPSATLTAYPGAEGTSDKVWVTFSANTDLTSFDGTDLAHSPIAIGATAGSFDGCAQLGTTQTIICDIADPGGFGYPVAAGDSVAIAAGKITSKASTPVANVAYSATVTADTTGPVLQSAKYSSSAVGGAQASNLITSTGGGEVAITARAGTAVAGKAGNGWTLTFTSNSGPTAVTVNSATKVVAVSADDGGMAPETASSVAIALGGNAAFSALFIATVDTSGPIATSSVAAAPFAGGADLLSIVATFSEPLSAASAGNFSSTVTGTIALPTVAATDDGRLTGVLTLTLPTNATVTNGVSTLTAAIGVKDRNGNAAAAGPSLTVALYAA
jgi:putative cell wall-binding protein